MKTVLAFLAVVVMAMAGCAAASYTADLDGCLKYAPNRQQVLQCQCQVAQSVGRSCDFLKDAGLQDE